MGEQRLLDLHGAHRPASRNDDIVRPAFVVEIALGVAVPPVFDVEPLALALNRNVAALVGWQDLASAVDNGDVPAGGGLAEGGGFDGVPLQTREIDDQHADFRGPVQYCTASPQTPARCRQTCRGPSARP